MIGTVLSNRYRLDEEIGIGGTAVVYKAKDTLLNRNVAVKILKDEFSDNDEFVTKFKREATAAASISDTNIVNIYDVGNEGNINYIVMECINGKTLKEYIKQYGTIDWKNVIGIALQIAKALNCAHKNGIIHRDIKPHNIMVTKEGLVKVTDFGIAKASSSATITSTNKVLGSAHYLSPEQAQGNAVDGRTDIYSFGIVLYEMVTGKVPHDADTPVSVALKHIQEPVIPPKSLNDKIPASLNNLILKCLEKSPDNRYQNVREILNDLTRIKNNYKLGQFDDESDDDDYTRVMDPVKVKNIYDSSSKSRDLDKDTYDEDIEEPRPRRGSSRDDDDDDDDNVSTKKKKIIIASIIGVIFVAAGILFFALGAGFLSSSPSSTKVKVPKIIGMSEADARSEAKKVNLTIEVVEREKSDKPEGTVVSCYPLEGTEVNQNSTIRVVISAGQGDSTVPSLRDLTKDAAEAQIKAAGCTVGDETYQYSNEVAAGSVISQDPEEGTTITKGMKINLVISSGPQDTKVAVPNVVGKSSSDAQAILQGAGFSVNIKNDFTTDPSKDGIVESQSLNGNASKGANITIVVYKLNTAAQAQPGNGTATASNGNGNIASGSGNQTGNTASTVGSSGGNSSGTGSGSGSDKNNGGTPTNTSGTGGNGSQGQQTGGQTGKK